MKLLYIIGFMGAGKTELASALSQKWNVPFLDTDYLLECCWGQPARDQYEQDPVLFIKNEADIVNQLSVLPRGIVSVGGGAITNDLVKAHLHSLPVLFLNSSVETCWQRVNNNRFLGLSLDEFCSLYYKRLPIYQKLCSRQISGGYSIDRLVLEVETAFELRREII